MQSIELRLRGDHIALDALLKACGACASGGEAKALIGAGRVRVNGDVELRRGRKLRAGDAVQAPGVRVNVEAPQGRPQGGEAPS